MIYLHARVWPRYIESNPISDAYCNLIDEDNEIDSWPGIFGLSEFEALGRFVAQSPNNVGRVVLAALPCRITFQWCILQSSCRGPLRDFVSCVSCRKGQQNNVCID